MEAQLLKLTAHQKRAIGAIYSGTLNRVGTISVSNHTLQSLMNRGLVSSKTQNYIHIGYALTDAGKDYAETVLHLEPAPQVKEAHKYTVKFKSTSFCPNCSHAAGGLPAMTDVDALAYQIINEYGVIEKWGTYHQYCAQCTFHELMEAMAGEDGSELVYEKVDTPALRLEYDTTNNTIFTDPPTHNIPRPLAELELLRKETQHQREQMEELLNIIEKLKEQNAQLETQLGKQGDTDGLVSVSTWETAFETFKVKYGYVLPSKLLNPKKV